MQYVTGSTSAVSPHVTIFALAAAANGMSRARIFTLEAFRFPAPVRPLGGDGPVPANPRRRHVVKFRVQFLQSKIIRLWAGTAVESSKPDMRTTTTTTPNLVLVDRCVRNCNPTRCSVEPEPANDTVTEDIIVGRDPLLDVFRHARSEQTTLSVDRSASRLS
ncbi:hypothetical protein EVAR_32501_1 [Eumeta japonica]|uniref:Uncharacterized protein n=1 Tax=Eumeta variegata TaxID=151549 RepID=A0A4C1W900_EUMVA|nr:hypothetical protein EVAR_32501_1 [Eumeta japonica]